jgi:chromosome segregation ATPase
MEYAQGEHTELEDQVRAAVGEQAHLMQTLATSEATLAELSHCVQESRLEQERGESHVLELEQTLQDVTGKLDSTAKEHAKLCSVLSSKDQQLERLQDRLADARVCF